MDDQGTARRIGLYGGTFDPIHHGHLITARGVLEQLDLEQVVFIPASVPPHKNDGSLIPFGDRAAMVDLAVGGEPGFVIDRSEGQRPGPSYTLHTVQILRERLGPAVQLFWLIGADSLAELAMWYRIAELARVCRIVTAARPGWRAPALGPLRTLIGEEAAAQLQRDILPTPQCDVSSREIRARVAAGRSIRYLVPEAVREYIEAHRLYRQTS